MEDRWNHQKARTEIQRSRPEPKNELNPMKSYRANTEEPFRSLSATIGCSVSIPTTSPSTSTQPGALTRHSRAQCLP